MRVTERFLAACAIIFVVTAVCVVHWLPHASIVAAQGRNAKTPPKSAPAVAPSPPLPAPAAEMREAILAATQSGRIEDLRVPLEWNELKPEIAANHVSDPIAYWKETSGDGEGREILAILAEILDGGHVALPLGKDVENNLMYVWPAISEAPLDKLTPAQEVQLYRMVKPAEAKAMREKKKWTWYRLVIGADGTWYAFQKSD
jgi:hypothetical protein